MDVAGIELATPCLQSREGKTLKCFDGVAYTTINKILALQMSRSCTEIHLVRAYHIMRLQMLARNAQL